MDWGILVGACASVNSEAFRFFGDRVSMERP
jgi:hypothetical protein